MELVKGSTLTQKIPTLSRETALIMFMEIADALYGVSMRQDGVSAVVGQRIVQRA